MPDPKAYPLINTIIKKPSIQSLYYSTGYFGINTNDAHLTTVHKSNYIKCYVSANKGSTQYIDPKYIKNPYDFWKVITPQGSGKGGDGFGKIIIAKPSEVASQTYFFFKVNSKKEAESLKSYLETETVNYLLSLRKIDQHISESTLAWIPIVPLDRLWTDAKVRSFFHLPLIKNTSIKVYKKYHKNRSVKNKNINN